jgi:hypothetical protein
VRRPQVVRLVATTPSHGHDVIEGVGPGPAAQPAHQVAYPAHLERPAAVLTLVIDPAGYHGNVVCCPNRRCSFHACT